MKNISYSEGTAYSCQTLVAIGAIAGHAVGQVKLSEICKPVANGFEIRFCKYPDITIKIDNSELVEWNDQTRNECEQDLKQRIESVKKFCRRKSFFGFCPDPVLNMFLAIYWYEFWSLLMPSL